MSGMKKVILLVCGLSVALVQARAAISAQAAEGKQVFETSCAVGYCHGLDGRAGKGPRLRDKVWSRSYLYKTIAQGVPGTSMPAWGGKLSDEKIAAVISYIFTISKEESAGEAKVEAVKESSEAATGEPVGRALFFDLTRDRNCGVCHHVGESGADVAGGLKGATIGKIVGKPVSERNVRVTLRDGEEFCGVKAGEDAGGLRVYDLGGAGPPVLRTIARGAIAGVGACPSLNAHADNSKIYSAQELGRIAAFLGQ
jgi:mono/diheme cytochrome c family protein